MKDQPFINNQVNLRYEPGLVEVNDVNLTGAFIFDGLLDYHGILSSISMVMDPDY